ncbi:hypothetical protein HDU89_006818 [Geranomyces variabilis]|nr:hypothetical protein HDU89_006818 [Geranomyces variabilis]
MMNGVNPIVLTMLACLIFEAVIIGTIGNLYEIEPTLSVRATGRWPLLGQTMNAAFDANQANDVSQGNMFGAICSPTFQAGTMTADPVVTCGADKTVCQAVVSGALHPLLSDSFRIPYEFGLSKVDTEDLVSGNVMGAQVRISCNSTQDFFLAESPVPPEWALGQVQINITLPNSSGGLEMIAIPGGITYQTPGLPEIGVIPTYITLESGAYLSLMFAKDFDKEFRGFKPYKDPVYGRNLGLTPVETAITYTTPALATHATKVDIVGPTEQVNITANDALQSALNGLSYWLSCMYWFCPRTPVIPTFDTLCLLLKQPATLADFDWEGQQATTMQGLAKATMMQFAAFALVTSTESRNITVPVTVRTKTQYSRLVISGPCTAILLAGAIASVVMITLKLLTDFAGRRYPALDAGLNITDSVYSFLAAFQSQFISSNATLHNDGSAHHHQQQHPQHHQNDHPPDSDPSRVRVCLLGKQLTLSDASFRHLRIDERERDSLAVHATLEKAGLVADDDNGRAERGETGKLLGAPPPLPAAAAQRSAEVEEDERL